jgi:zinc D-Ala-D-Ala carboxypeptidase
MYAQSPFHINSGKRCVKHNTEVGGKKKSAHLGGYAFDVKCENSADRFRLVRCFLRAGFVRMGIYKTFIHVDADPSNPQEVIW